MRDILGEVPGLAVWERGGGKRVRLRRGIGKSGVVSYRGEGEGMMVSVLDRIEVWFVSFGIRELEERVKA